MQLGKSSLEISRVVLGCMWPERLDEREIQRIVHAACDAGISAFDTAPLYGFHTSEEVLGRALRDRRGKVQLLTKAGLRWDDSHGELLFELTEPTGARRSVRKDSRPAQLVSEVESSLKRLGTDVIDLLQIHHPDPLTPLEDSLAALSELVRAGKVRTLGVSNFSPTQLARASKLLPASTPLSALQCEYNLLQRWPEAELFPICRAHQLSVLAYSPLAKGTLAGRTEQPPARRRARASDDSLWGHPLARALVASAVRDVLEPIATRHAASASQIALAWLLAVSKTHAVVVGASDEQQARRNAEAERLSLSPAEVSEIRARFERLDTPLKALAKSLRLPGLARLDRLAQRLLRKLL